MASAPAKSTVRAKADSTASSPAESTSSAPAKNAEPSSSKNAEPSSSKNGAPSSSNNKGSSSSENTTRPSSKGKAPVLVGNAAKSTVPALAKNKASVPHKNTEPASTKNGAKNKGPLSAKNTPPVPTKNMESAADKIATPGSVLHGILHGLLNAFAHQVHGAPGVPDTDNDVVEDSAEEETVVKEAPPTKESSSGAPGVSGTDSDVVEDSADEEGTEVKEAPIEESKGRRGRQSWLYGKQKKTQQQAPPPPLMAGGEVVTRDLVQRYSDYCRYRLSCAWGKTVCQMCVIEDEKDIGHTFQNPKMVSHCQDKHKILSGLPCKERDCRVIVRTPRELALHAHFCHELASGWWWQQE